MLPNSEPGSPATLATVRAPGRWAVAPGGQFAPAISAVLGLGFSYVIARPGVADAVFHVDRNADVHPWAVVAWAFFGAFVAYSLLDVRARSADTAGREARRDSQLDGLVATTTDLARRPSIEVVEGYYDFTRRVNEVQQSLLRAAPGAMPPDEVDEHIRSSLQAVLSLLQRFDTAARGPKGTQVEYTANLMVFRRGGDLGDDACRDLERRMLFQSGEIDVRRLPGVLELRREWSVTSATAGGQGIDTKIDALVLQIPLNFSAGDQHLALPGAPTAWCMGTIDAVHDVDEIPGRITREHTATKQAADKVKPYFDTQARHVRSFISVPLDPPDNGAERLGVLNLNCSLKGMLGGAGEVERIGPLLKTLCVPLSGAVQAALGLLASPNGAGRDGGATPWLATPPVVPSPTGSGPGPQQTGTHRVTPDSADSSVRRRSGAKSPLGKRHPLGDEEPPRGAGRPKRS